MPNSTFGSLRARTPSLNSRADPTATPALAKELTDSARQTLAFRLAALAVMAYLARFLVGLVKYALDAALLLLLATSAAAVVGPSAKNNMLSQLLVQIESFVSPVFAVIADRGFTAVSGPAKLAAQYLGIGPGPTRA